MHRILAGEIGDSAEAMELAARFTASDLGRRAAIAARIEREFDFLFSIEDVVLRGQIDLWFEEAGELIVVDYKTDREERSAQQYALQLRLYALALEQYAGRLAGSRGALLSAFGPAKWRSVSILKRLSMKRAPWRGIS